jgi:two-component system cell cycle response regulator
VTDNNNKPRILAVDDSRVMRKAMSKVLGKECDVIEAEHGEDAWTLLTNDDSIQVVFTDLSMPYLDGFGLLERIRTSEDPRMRDMPVIIITGKEDDDETKQDALSKGATDFITKPFDSIQLQARAKTHINTSKKITEVENKLERQSAVDEITGLGGQRYFCKAANETLAYLKRHGGQHVLMRMDIDHFDKIFIKAGKSFADGILKEVGNRLSKAVRQEDMLARIGLNKFAMLLRSTSMEEAIKMSERICSEVSGLKFKSGTTSLRITVSIGLLEPGIDESSEVEQQLQQTEVYLKQAIDAGGNRVVAHSDFAKEAEATIDLNTAMDWLQKGQTDNLSQYKESLKKQIKPLLDFLGL